MDVSLGALRKRLLELRAWDSSGTTFDNRVREALNTALDRMAGDVPQALIPDEEHVVLYKDIKSGDHNLAIAATSHDPNVLEITDKDGVALFSVLADATASLWADDDLKIDGTWDGIMHLEVKDPSGVWHRRQSLEWWKDTDDNKAFVSIDRAWPTSTDQDLTFRIHQPEFFVADDVMEVLEPIRVYDDTRQQVWAIDTGGAYRQDMVDFQANTTGRPYRFWRGRHYQVPAPTEAPTLEASTTAEEAKGGTKTWVGPWQQGNFKFLYTYVRGRRDEEWQEAPSGIRDPQWESAPSPVSTTFSHNRNPDSSIKIKFTNLDAMMDYDTFNTSGAGVLSKSYTGMRIRIYVARFSVKRGATSNAFDQVEKAQKYYLLTEVEPTAQEYEWTGAVVPDYHRPLKHSTGYFAHKVYPHQDARYEMDLRVLRLPRKYEHDQDTAPIQRDAVPALMELALYYLCLQDGVDQTGAKLHLDRYDELARRYRLRYANTGRIVEPVPIGGHVSRKRFGTFSASE